MTRDEIMNLSAGRQLDYEIALYVFGKRELWRKENKEGTPNYSTDIAAAWEVVQHFVNTTCERPKINRVAENEWRVQLNDFDETAVAYSSSTPLAICRAALLAVIEKDAETR